MKQLSIAALILSIVIGSFTIANAQQPIDDLIDPSWLDMELVVQERKTAKMFAVTDWRDEPSGYYCMGGDRPAWDDLLDSWYDAITGEGLWVDRGEYRICAWGHCEDVYEKGGRIVDRTDSSVLTSIRSRMFADEDVVDWGRDHEYSDSADAVMWGWHGSRFLLSSDELTYAGKMRIEVGDEDCWLHGDELQLGDGDMEFLHLSSCQSVNWDLWATWWKAFGGLHVLTGFHGVMYVAREQEDEYRNFANEAFHTSIADAWLDNFYRPLYRDPYDQCPVAYSVGANVDDVLTRLSTERYNLVQRDPRGATAHGAMWIGGCAPSEGAELPYVFSAPLYSPEDDSSRSATTGSQSPWLDPQQVRAMVEQVLPQWDQRLLQVQNGENWVEQLSFEKVLMAVDYDPSSNERNLIDEEIVRLHKDEGKIYYLNRKFAWNLHDDDTHELMSEGSAAARVREALEAMGVPVSELGEPRVGTQVLGGDLVGAIDGQSNVLTYEMYRIVTYPRIVATGAGEVPVHGSDIRAAVNSKLQRIKVDHPPFVRKPRLKLRNRQAVIDDAVQKIMKRNPEQGMMIKPVLVYKRGNDPNTPRYFVPAVAFLVESGLTPFEVLVRVAR